MTGQVPTSCYLTVAHVAALLSLSELTVRRKIRAGEIPAVRVGTSGRGALRIPEDALYASLRQVVDEPDEAA